MSVKQRFRFRFSIMNLEYVNKKSSKMITLMIRFMGKTELTHFKKIYRDTRPKPSCLTYQYFKL